MDSPKVLIINQPFDTVTGGGITLSNLFSGYDKEKLAVVCSGYLINNNTNFDVCSQYYQIGHLEHKWRFPFNLMKRKYYSGKIEAINSGEKQIQEKIPSENLRIRLINNVFYPTLKFLGLYHYSSTQKLSQKFCDWLDEYNPDILYAQASSLNSIQFCGLIQKYLNKPLIFHMMDDWPTPLKSEGLFGNFWYNKIEKEFNELFEKTSLFLAISDLMSKEYGERYGKEWITFHNPIDIEFWKQYRNLNIELKSPPVLLYAGRVGTGIETSLEVIAKSVEIVNEKTGLGLQFALQTPESPKWISKYKNTRHNSYVDYEELPRVFSEADFLILPYDFEEEGLNFIRLSMPTKAPEYLASGTPVIIFSPKSTAVVDYVNQHQCALTVLKNDPAELADNLIELVGNKELRFKLSHNGISVAEKHHSSVDVRNKFQNLLKSLN